MAAGRARKRGDNEAAGEPGAREGRSHRTGPRGESRLRQGFSTMRLPFFPGQARRGLRVCGLRAEDPAPVRSKRAKRGGGTAFCPQPTTHRVRPLNGCPPVRDGISLRGTTSPMDALTFLGTGCGIPMTDRFHSSILLESGGRRWLLDTGEPCSQRLKAHGRAVPVAGRRFHQPRAFGSSLRFADDHPGRVARRTLRTAAALSPGGTGRSDPELAGGGCTCRKGSSVSPSNITPGKRMPMRTRVTLDAGRLRDLGECPTTHLDGLRDDDRPRCDRPFSRLQPGVRLAGAR